MRKQALMTAVLGSVTTVAIAQPHNHGDDGIIGIDAAGKLAIEMDLDEAFEFEEFFSGSGLNGYISDEPEFTPPVIYSLQNRQKLVYLIEARPENAGALKPGQIVDVRLPGDGKSEAAK